MSRQIASFILWDAKCLLSQLLEILSENEAYFYEPDNAQDLASKIKQIMTNPQDSELKVDNARKKVEEYAWTKRAGKILEIMNK